MEILRSGLQRSIGVCGLALVLSALVFAAPAPDPASAAEPHVDATASWTVYHGDALGTGADLSGVTFSPPNHAWTSPVLDGQVYGEPLEATGRVYVATENDTIYALAANTGAILWFKHVGTPVPQSDLACSGDIGPTVGITGTPVLDVGRGEIYAVADTLAGGVPAHVLVGLDMYTGTYRMNSEAVDPPLQSTGAILQRTGLNLSDGNVVFGYGGNDGDCGSYSGWVVSVPEGGGTPGFYQAVPIGNDGAIWMGGAAPEVDAAGNIWVATGNGSSSNSYDFSDSVIELSPGLARTQYFAPSTWPYDNSHDLDLGSSSPALLSNGTALQVGKSSTAYLLNQSTLGGMQPDPLADLAPAAATPTVATPSRGRWSTCRAAAGCSRSRRAPWARAWQTSSGANGPPITAGGLVWSIGGSTLFGLNPATGTRSSRCRSAARPTTSPPRRWATASCWLRTPTRWSRSRARPACRGRRRHPRRHRPTRRTGWWHRTAGSSRSATHSSTARLVA